LTTKTKPFKRTLLKNLRLDAVALVDKGAAGTDLFPARIALWKRRSEVKKDIGMTMEDLLKMLADLTPEQKAQAMQALGGGGQPQNPGGASPAAGAGGGGGGPPPPHNPFGKRLDPEVEEFLSKQRKDAEEQLAKRDAELKKQSDIIEKLQADGEVRELVEKVRTEFKTLSGEPVALAKILRKADKGIALDKAEGEELRRILAAYEGQAVEAAHYKKQLGTRGSTVTDGSSLGKLTAIAKALVEKTPTLTEAQAFEQAARQNPSLYSEHRSSGA